MAPSSSVIALTLAFGIGGRSGDSFCLQNLGWTSSAACSRRRPRPATAVANTPTTAGLAAQGEGGSGYRGGSNENGRYENFLGQTSAGTEGTAFVTAQVVAGSAAASSKDLCSCHVCTCETACTCKPHCLTCVTLASACCMDEYVLVSSTCNDVCRLQSKRNWKD